MGWAGNKQPLNHPQNTVKRDIPSREWLGLNREQNRVRARVRDRVGIGVRDKVRNRNRVGKITKINLNKPHPHLFTTNLYFIISHTAKPSKTIRIKGITN